MAWAGSKPVVDSFEYAVYVMVLETNMPKAKRRQNNNTNYTRWKTHVNMRNTRKRTFCRPALKWDFHAVFKTWLTSSIVLFRRRWSQQNFSQNRNIQGNQSKDMLSEIRGLRRNRFLASRRCKDSRHTFRHFLFSGSLDTSVWSTVLNWPWLHY